MVSWTQLPNPFMVDALKRTGALPPGHVSELHAPALAAIHQTIASCWAAKVPSSVLILGEAGSGKTHLLAQMRHELAASPSAVVIEINMFGASQGMLWRHVRRELVTGLLKTSAPDVPSALTRILHARYPELLVRSGGSMFDILIGGWSAGPTLASLLAKETELPLALRTALGKLHDKGVQNEAVAWLKGDQLAEDKLQVLGLPSRPETDQELEATSRQVVLAFCALAGEKVSLVLAFDNIETVQATLADPEALRALAWLVGELATGDGSRVVVTFIRPETMLTLQKAADSPAIQRMSATRASIPYLGQWEHVVRLVATRLEAQDDWRQARKPHPEPHWPLGEAFLRDLVAKNKRVLTPRHLIGACRVELERLRTGKPTFPPPDGGDNVDTPQPPKPAPAFDVPWSRRRDKHLGSPAALAFDSVLGLGLPWLAETVGAGFTRFEHQLDDYPDVSVVFRSADQQRMIGVSCCDQVPAQLRWRLVRLEKQWANRGDAVRLDALTIVRQASAKLTDAAKERLDALRGAGVAVLLLPREQYAELAAYQRIFADVHAGNFTDFGRPVTAAEFATWARGHLSSAVKELADALFGATPAAKPAVRKTSKSKA